MFLRKKDDKQDEASSKYDYFHNQKNYGKGVRPFVWEGCQTDLEEPLINLIIERVKEIGINVVEFSTMMTKVREFYDEKYLDAMPDEEIQEDLDNVSNDKASENQEKVVSIITRFLSLDKKCQKSFANFKNCNEKVMKNCSVLLYIANELKYDYYYYCYFSCFSYVRF